MTGDRQANRNLRALEAKIAKKITRTAAREGLRPVLAAARRLAPRGETGVLRKTIKLKSLKRSRSAIGARVTSGTREGGDYTGKAFYGAFLEYGTKRIKPRGFLKRAAETKKRSALTIYRARLAAGIRSAVSAMRK